MYPINEIFRTFGPEYIQRFGKSMPNDHLKVINAIIACRTQECGLVIYECTRCGVQHISFRSCGNRHCPACQNHKTRLWVKKQMDQQLTGHHFMVTFTVPEHLRGFIRSNQRVSYTAMSKIFKAKFCEEMKKAGLWDQIPQEVWKMDWNVN